jgi:hypothetical protein
MPTDSPKAPLVGEFYRHRSGLYIALIIGLPSHVSLGHLVQIRCFHGPYARQMTLNPRLFTALFEHVPLDDL